MPAQLKRARADFVIENDSAMPSLARQVDELWSVLASAAAGETTGSGR
jgi:dephospho-CoA kinase